MVYHEVCSSPEIVIVRLTRSLVAELEEEAYAQLNGDSSCSLSNMSKSCFAVESCAQGIRANMNLRELLNHTHPYVALTEDAPDGTRLGRRAFVGCVSGNATEESRRLSAMFPEMRGKSERCMVLYNLCVADAYRNMKVGRRLLERVASSSRDDGSVMHLLVMKTTSDMSEDIRFILEPRAKKLTRAYERMNLEVTCENDSAILMTYRR